MTSYSLTTDGTFVCLSYITLTARLMFEKTFFVDKAEVKKREKIIEGDMIRFEKNYLN